MGSTFRVNYKNDDGVSGPTAIFCGPKGKTVEDCEKIARLAASKYEIDPESFVIEEIPERVSHGFLHPIQALTPEGRTATITNWYF